MEANYLQLIYIRKESDYDNHKHKTEAILNGKYNICLCLRHYQPDTGHHHLNRIWLLPISVYYRGNDSYRFLSSV